MSNQWYFFLLGAFWGFEVGANPFLITCIQKKVDLTIKQYVNELFDIAEYLREIENIMTTGQDKVRSKLNEFEEKLSDVQFSGVIESNVVECFDIVSNKTKHGLMDFHNLVKHGSANLVEYLQKAINSIHDCGKLETSCEVIDLCCNDVVDDFDVNAFVASIQKLKEVGERFINTITDRLDDENDNIVRTIYLCRSELQQTKEEEERQRWYEKHGTNRMNLI